MRRSTATAPVLSTAMALSTAMVLALPAAGRAAQPADPSSTSGATATSYDVGGSGYEGGGFQNTLAIGPSGTWLSGGDVAGISRSVDGGHSWTASNAGLTDARDLRVASIVYAPTADQPRRVLAGVGTWAAGPPTAAGGLLESTDDGVTWSVLSPQVHFSAIDQPRSGPAKPPPRPTGHLLVSQPDGTLLAGTYDQGVQRSPDHGATWQSVGVTGTIRSLVARPTDPDLLYAATDTGVWRSTGHGDATSFQELTGAPAGVEELTWVAGALYAAAGKNGLYRFNGTRWLRLGKPTLPAGSVWTAIVGYRACGRTLLYAGNQNGGVGSVVRSVDAGRTWQSAVQAAVPTVGGPGGQRWWLAARPSFMLGAASYTAAQLALPPGSGCDRPVAVAGRSGIWESTAPGSVAWYPMVGRLGVTVVNSVAVDPHDPQRTLAASFDWPLVASTDQFAQVTPFQPGQGTAAASGLGTAVTFDSTTTPSMAYLAAAKDLTNSLGEVYSSTDPTDPASWTSLRLGDATGGGLPFALTTLPAPGGSVLLAAVQGSGIWRRESGSTGTWAPVPTPDPFTNESRLGGSFARFDDGTVFFLDVNSGLYRSSDFGAAPWQLIWDIKTTNPNGGHLAADPTTPGRLYVSIGYDQVRKQTPGLCSIDAAATVRPVDDAVPCRPLLRSPRVGPVHVDPGDGSVLVTRRVDTGKSGLLPAQLCRSEPHGSGTWSDLADDAFRATGGYARSLAVGTDGTAYVALAGEGVLVAHPADRTPVGLCTGA